MITWFRTREQVPEQGTEGKGYNQVLSIEEDGYAHLGTTPHPDSVKWCYIKQIQCDAKHNATPNKLIAEIERRKQIHKSNVENGFPDEANKITEDNDILYIIKSLQQEQQEEPDKDLEEEVKNYFQGYWPGTETAEQCNTDLHFAPLAILRLAHHFAKWGAEHLRDSTKMIDKSLEEAAERFSNTQNKNFLNPEIVKIIFIAGAEWKGEQMLKEAVECDVIVPIYEGNDVWSAEIKIPGRYDLGDKVKLIILGGDKFKAGDRIIYHGNGYEITGVDDKWYKVKADIPSQIPELEINAISKDNEKDIKRQE